MVGESNMRPRKGSVCASVYGSSKIANMAIESYKTDTFSSLCDHRASFSRLLTKNVIE